MANLDINNAIQYGLFARWAGNEFAPTKNTNGLFTQWSSIYNASQVIDRIQWISGYQGLASDPQANPRKVSAQMAVDASLIAKTASIGATYANDLKFYNDPITDGVNAKYHKGITLSKPILNNTVDIAPSLVQDKINLGAADTTHQKSRVDTTAPTGKQASVDFIVTPNVGVNQELTNEKGANITETITNGITDGTSHEWTYSTALRIGVEGKVGIPFLAEGTVKTEVENLWSNTWGSSQTIDFSKENEKGSSTRTEAKTTISWQPTAEPSFTWTNSLDPQKTYTIKMGDNLRFVLEVEEGKSNTTTHGKWDITANSDLILKDSLGNQVKKLAGPALKDASDWNYAAIGGVPLDKTTITFEGNKAVYTGNATLTTDYGYNAKVRVYKLETANKWVPLNSLSNSNNAESINSKQMTFNLKEMLKFVDSNSGYDGICFDDTKDESLIKSSEVKMTGADSSSVHVGNLNYSFIEFRNSQIRAGDGDNNLVIASTEDKNTVHFGNGNNTTLIEGDSNTVIMGEGNNVIIIGGSGTNVIDVGKGADVLKLTSLNSLTYVNNWRFNEDTISFGASIDPSKIAYSFDEGSGSYAVQTADGKVIAILYPDSSNIPSIDPTTGRFEGEILYSLPYASRDNTLFTTDVFAELLNRAPTKSEIADINNKLNQNLTTRGEMVASILKSPEFIKQFSDDTTLIQSTYLDVFGRVADAEGLSFWKDAFANGLSKQAFADYVTHSTEFIGLIGLNAA